MTLTGSPTPKQTGVPVQWTYASAPDGVEVLLYDMNHCEEMQMLSAMPPERAGLLHALAEERYRAEHRRREWLAVRAALYEICPEAEIGYLPTGRPFLAGLSANEKMRHFSLSHSGEYVALARAVFPVGIDLECRRPKVLRLAEKFLSPEELRLLEAWDSLGYPDAERMCLALWTAKEAAYKYFDRVGSTIADIRITGLGKSVEGRATGNCSLFDCGEARLQIHAFPDFTLSLCFS